MTFAFLVLTCKSVLFLPDLVLRAPFWLFMVTPRTTWSSSPNPSLSMQDEVRRGRTCSQNKKRKYHVICRNKNYVYKLKSTQGRTY